MGRSSTLLLLMLHSQSTPHVSSIERSILAEDDKAAIIWTPMQPNSPNFSYSHRSSCGGGGRHRRPKTKSKPSPRMISPFAEK
eukprot:1392551-Amphidinium_carterae.1